MSYGLFKNVTYKLFVHKPAAAVFKNKNTLKFP